MKLTENIKLDDLIYTETGLYNTPGQVELEKLLYLSNYILEEIIKKWGELEFTSGYRSKRVNEKTPGASLTSQHPLGEAADFIPKQEDIDKVFKWCCENLKYGQCILEEKIKNGKRVRWIHISLIRVFKANMMAMTFDGAKYNNINV